MTTRQPPAEPRAPWNGGPPSSPAPVAMPKYVEAAGPNVAQAWAAQQGGEKPLMGEIDEEAFRLIEVTREEARELAQTWRYEIIHGPTEGYRGGAFLDRLPDDHEAVRAVYTVVRCIKYEAQLQDRAPALEQAKQAAQKKAEDEADAAIAADVARWQDQVNALANDVRRGGDTSGLIRPVRQDPDLTEVRRFQARLARLEGEIIAVQHRKENAGRVASATFTGMAEAAVQLLWIGPAGDASGPTDWGLMYEAYDRLKEVATVPIADDLMEKAVARWKVTTWR